MRSFEVIAEDWAKLPQPSMFCRFSDSSFRWADNFITRIGQQYEIKPPTGARRRAASLRQAADAIGAPDDALTRWAYRVPLA